MSKRLSYKIEIMLILGVVFALFYKLGFMPMSADEPIRTLVALDMVVNGHFLAPELNGDSYLNKPPLYNWILWLIYKVTGNYGEFITRLPSIIPLLLFIPTIFWVSKKHLKDKKLSILIGLAFVTTGNIWFYSGYLGHIDILFSLLTFLQLYFIIHFSEKQQWWWCFIISYCLAVLGFLMKGLPSIVFQGITISVCLILNKNFKKLFSLPHVIGSLFFVLPVIGYLFLFSEMADATELLQTLLFESTSRTVTDKSIFESILHLLSFPFLFLVDIMPWGLVCLVFLSKKVRKTIWQHKFYKTSLIVFGANILIYWLSPDYRARYVFMLIPFLLIPSFAGLSLIMNKLHQAWYWILMALGVLSIPLIIYFGVGTPAQNGWPNPYIFHAILLILISILLVKTNHFRKINAGMGLMYATVGFLIVARFFYTVNILQPKVLKGPYFLEQKEAKEIVEIIKDAPLYMYHSNVSLTMNWYISEPRKQMLVTKRTDFEKDAFYLVPDDVLKDPDNVEVFYNFIRRFKHKPFSLVKFKHYFPEMPKKNEL